MDHLLAGAHRCRARFALCATALAAGLAAPAPAQVSLNSEFVVNQVTAGDQLSFFNALHQPNRIAELTNGDRVVLYSDLGGADLGAASGVFATILTAADAVQTGLNVSADAAADDPGGVAALTTGGFVAAFSTQREGGDFDCYIRGFNNDGSEAFAARNVFAANAVDERYCDIAPLSGGDFFVVSERSEATANIYGQRFNADGSTDGGVVTLAGAARDQRYPIVTGLSSGGYAAAWTDDGGDGGGLGVFTRIFDASGVETTPGAVLVNAGTTAGDQRSPNIDQLSDGGLTYVWEDENDNTIRARVLTATGAESVAPFTIEAGANWSSPHVAALPAGGFLVAKTSSTGFATDASASAVAVSGFDNDGARTAAPQLVNAAAANAQEVSPIAAFSDGRFLVAYRDASGLDGAGAGVVARSGARISFANSLRLIDAVMLGTSDFGAAGTLQIAEEVDLEAARIVGDLDFGLVVLDPDQFVDYPSGGKVEIALSGAVFDRSVQDADFSSGGSCVMIVESGGVVGESTVVFATTDLTRCDDQVGNRVVTDGSDDDMQFSLRVLFTDEDVNFIVRLTDNIDRPLDADEHDNDDSTREADPVAAGVNGFQVRSFGTGARTADNPFGAEITDVLLSTDYNALASDTIGTLEAAISGLTYTSGTFVSAALSDLAAVTLTLTFEDAAGLRAATLSDGTRTMTTPIEDSQAVFALTPSTVLRPLDLGSPLTLRLEADGDPAERIGDSAITAFIDADFLPTLTLDDETETTGVNSLLREGVRASYRWVFGSRVETSTLFRLTGLDPDDPPGLLVRFNNTSEGLTGEYELFLGDRITPGGELVVTAGDLEAALGASFTHADVTLTVETLDADIRRFNVSNGLPRLGHD